MDKPTDNATKTASHIDAEYIVPQGAGQTKTSSSARMVVFPPADPTSEQRMKLIEDSDVLDFWDRPEEDGYTETDGAPI